MENIEISLRGITRHPSDKSNPMGDLDDCINMENYYGELRPVYPPEKDIANGTKTGLIYIWSKSGDEYKFYNTGTSIKIYKNNEVGAISTQLITGINGIESVGNTIVVSTTSGIYYYLFKNNTFTALGKTPPAPVLNIETEDGTLESNSDWFGLNDGNELNNDIAVYMSNAADEILKKEALDRANTKFMASLVKRIAANDKDGYITFPFFVRYALRMYDGTLIKHSAPILINPSTGVGNKYEQIHLTYNVTYTGTGDTQVTLVDTMSAKIARLKLLYSTVVNALYSNWSDVVTSVDVFMSKPEYTVDVNGKITIGTGNSEPILGTQKSFKIGVPAKSNDAVLSALSSEGNFYMIDSIGIDKFTGSVRSYYAPITKELLSSIVSRERMTDDYGTHNSIVGESIHVYNSRLNVSGVKHTMFAGFYANATTDIIAKKVASSSGLLAVNSIFLFYPDVRATRMVAQITAGTYIDVPLVPHPSLNGSYYINPTLGVLTYNTATAGAAGETVVDDISDKLYSSEIGNPFLFKPSGIISFPGIVKGTATTTEPLSQGQFGQFPLYVFTDKGTWALEIASTGAYSTKQVVTREICINPDSIVNMKREVAFMTERGLCIISGKDTEIITLPLEDANYKYSNLCKSNLEDYEDVLPLLTKANVNLTTAAVDHPKFSLPVNTNETAQANGSYMSNARPAFDAANERIYLYNPLYTYSYIFNISSKTWSRVTDQFSNVVSSYPGIYFEKTGANPGLYKPTMYPATTDRDVYFITRAIKAAEVNYLIKELKMVATIDNRADVVVGEVHYNNTLALYASRDGVNYAHIASSFSDRLRVKGTAYKYFKIAYAGKLTPSDRIAGFLAKIELKYTNHLR